MVMRRVTLTFSVSRKYGACFLVSFCQSPFTKLTLILLIIGDVHRAVRKSNDQ